MAPEDGAVFATVSFTFPRIHTACVVLTPAIVAVERCLPTRFTLPPSQRDHVG